MPRVPANTITKTPNLIRTGGGNAPMPGSTGGAIVGAVDKLYGPRIDFERYKGRRDAAFEADKWRQRAKLAGDALDLFQIYLRHEDRQAQQLAVEYERHMLDALVGTPEKPGASEAVLKFGPDKTVEDGVSKRLADASREWLESNEMSGYRRDRFDRRAQQITDAYLARGNAMDMQNARALEKQTLANEAAAKADTAMAMYKDPGAFYENASVAASVAAYNKTMKRGMILNWDGTGPMPVDGDGKPSLKFADRIGDGEKSVFEDTFNAAFAAEFDVLNTRRFNALVHTAVNADTEQESEGAFDALVAAGEAFIGSENKINAEAAYDKAVEERRRVLARREAAVDSNVADIIRGFEFGRVGEDEVLAAMDGLGEARKNVRLGELDSVKTAQDISAFRTYAETLTGDGITLANAAQARAQMEEYANSLTTEAARDAAHSYIRKMFMPRTAKQADRDTAARDAYSLALKTGHTMKNGRIVQMPSDAYLAVAREGLAGGHVTQAEYLSAIKNVQDGVLSDPEVNRRAWETVTRYIGEKALAERFAFDEAKGTMLREKGYKGDEFREKADFIPGWRGRKVDAELVETIYDAAREYTALKKLGGGTSLPSFDEYMTRALRDSNALKDWNSARLSDAIHSFVRDIRDVRLQTVEKPLFWDKNDGEDGE